MSADVFQKLLLVRSVRFRKARALLFFLLHASEQDHRSEKIADVFWRDYPHVKAMANLRQTTRQIRLLLEGVKGVELETRRGHLGLRCADNASLDVQLCGLLGQPDWPENIGTELRNYQQEFDLLLGVSDAFDSWLSIRKTQATQAIAEVLEGHFRGGPDTKVAVSAAKMALEIEPANEMATRFLMRHYWAKQQATRAVEAYNALYVYLDENFDQEPDAKTIDLLASIKLGDPIPAANAGSGTPPQIQVQVQNAAQLDAETKSLLNVLQLDLRLRLSRFREWEIVDENAAGTPDLVVKLELLPNMHGQPLHIEISDPLAGKLLWAEMVSAPQENWDEKVRTQLGNIANALSLGAGKSLAPKQDSSVYDRWLRSQVLMDMWSPETEGAAIGMLSDITKESPRFGPAHAELAGALNVRHILLPGTTQTEAEKQRALHHALEAIALDPLDTRAHRVLAWCYCHKSEFELAEFHFEQALHLNSSNSLTLASCALGFAFANRLETAQEICARMLRAPGAMQPFHMVYLAAVNYLGGAYEQAAAQCAQAGDIMTTVGGWHAAALEQLGEHEQAQKRISRFIGHIRGLWAMPDTPDDDAVLEWFAACFPMRGASRCAALRETVGRALDAG